MTMTDLQRISQQHVENALTAVVLAFNTKVQCQQLQTALTQARQ